MGGGGSGEKGIPSIKRAIHINNKSNQEIEHLVTSNGLDHSLLRNPYTDLHASEIRRKWSEVSEVFLTNFFFHSTIYRNFFFKDFNINLKASAR